MRPRWPQILYPHFNFFLFPQRRHELPPHRVNWPPHRGLDFTGWCGDYSCYSPLLTANWPSIDKFAAQIVSIDPKLASKNASPTSRPTNYMIRTMFCRKGIPGSEISGINLQYCVPFPSNHSRPYLCSHSRRFYLVLGDSNLPSRIAITNLDDLFLVLSKNHTFIPSPH